MLSKDKKNNVNSTIIQGSEYAISKMLNDNTASQYENTLKENRFPQQLQVLLDSQLAEIKGTVAKVKSLEDLAEN